MRQISEGGEGWQVLSIKGEEILFILRDKHVFDGGIRNPSVLPSGLVITQQLVTVAISILT